MDQNTNAHLTKKNSFVDFNLDASGIQRDSNIVMGDWMSRRTTTADSLQVDPERVKN